MRKRRKRKWECRGRIKKENKVGEEEKEKKKEDEEMKNEEKEGEEAQK